MAGGGDPELTEVAVEEELEAEETGRDLESSRVKRGRAG